MLGFVHVPKTGGTYISVRVVPIEYANKTSYMPYKVHMPVSKIQEEIGECNIFTMVRNPYDRTCSEYNFICRNAENIFYYGWDTSSDIKIRLLARQMENRLGRNNYATKVYNIYKYNMSIEDYLEWSGDNPSYPLFYDTMTPKDMYCVGVTEHMNKTVDLLQHMGIQRKPRTKEELLATQNVDKSVGKPYITKYPREKFEKDNIDYEMYYEGLENFHRLCKKYLK